jgi:hypothetical protein
MGSQEELRKIHHPTSGQEGESAHTAIPGVSVDPTMPPVESSVSLPDPDQSLPSQDEEIAK